MKYQPKFNGKEPQNKEERLICELAKDLHDVQRVFINLNKLSCTDHEIFITLRDSALAFAGQTIQALTKLMTYKDEIPIFLKESQDIFNCYIEQALGDT